MNFDEKSILSTINPVVSLIGFVLIILISFYSAYRFRDTNDFKKSLKFAMFLFAIAGIVLMLLDLPLFLIIGYGLCICIFTAWFSNYFFYH
jgi:uncharacterized membrane protein